MKKQYLLLGFVLVIIFGHANYVVAEYCENDAYRSYDNLNDDKSIKTKLTTLVNKAGDFATLLSTVTPSLPKTYKSKTIEGIVITSPTTSTTSKATVLITGAIHANEWIGTEVAIGLAEYLVTYKTNPSPPYLPLKGRNC